MIQYVLPSGIFLYKGIISLMMTQVYYLSLSIQYDTI